MTNPPIKGEEVLSLQRRLQALCFYFGALNGMYDGRTADAVQSFQRFVGLPITGQADRQTWKRLFGSQIFVPFIPTAFGRTLKLTQPPMQGTDVIVVQMQLKQSGFFQGEIDGIFGEQTRDAVEGFQSASRLTPDGMVGIETGRILLT